MIKKIIIFMVLISSYSFADTTSKTSDGNYSLPVLNKDVAVPTNKSAEYVYVYQNDTLSTALGQYAKNNGLNIKFAPDLTGSILAQAVSGRFNVKNEADVLDILADKYAFAWFVYSGTLYISSSKEVSQSINVAAEELGTIKASLDQMGLLNSKFGYSQGNGKIVISGPSEYVDMVVHQINSLDISPVNQQFAVYRLKYANANDITLNLNSQSVTVPGVVTILQNLLQGKSGKNSANNNPLLSTVAQPLLNGTSATTANSSSSKSADNSSDNSSSSGSVSTPLIQADAHLNTIIIRDKKSNLAIYKNLIDILDVPSPLIQVDVLIVRLNNTKLNQAGINWWTSNGNVGVGYGASNLSTTTPSSNLSAVFGQIGSSSQLLLNTTTGFLASLDYLQQEQIAEAVSRPAIVTTDNIPAIVSVNDSFYVNALGASSSTSSSTSSNAFNQVTVSTSLQVTPHVIFTKDGKKQIKLSIALQDGNVDSSLASQMPDTVQSSLNSQAVITEGQSLLLAGYTKDKNVQAVKKVPFLGDIPLLGWFFKSTSSDIEKFTTFYFVSPKIVWLSDSYKLKGYVMVNDQQLNTSPYDETLKKNINK